MSDKTRKISWLWKTLGLFLLVAAITVSLLFVLDRLTDQRVSEIARKRTVQLVTELFPGAESSRLLGEEPLFYAVLKDQTLCGFAVETEATEKGITARVLVGLDTEGTIVGVLLRALSGTSETVEETYFDRFIGQNKAVSSADEKSSSPAILSGINEVLAMRLDASSIAEEYGWAVLETEPPITEPPVTTVPPDTGFREPILTTVPDSETEPTGTEGSDVPPVTAPVVLYPDTTAPSNRVDVVDRVTAYETETLPPETTEEPVTTEVPVTTEIPVTTEAPVTTEPVTIPPVTTAPPVTTPVTTEPSVTTESETTRPRLPDSFLDHFRPRNSSAEEETTGPDYEQEEPDFVD